VWGIRLALVVALGLGAAAALQAWRAGARPDRVIPGVRLDEKAVGGRPLAALRRAHQAREKRLLEREVSLTWPGGRFTSTFHTLGVTPRSAKLWPRLAKLGRRGGLFEQLIERQRARRGELRFTAGLGLDPARSLAALERYKAQVDVRARSARLDLINRRIVPGRIGYTLDVYQSQERVLAAARAGRTEVKLAVDVKRPKLSAGQLQDLDISTVLGWYETPYSLSRTYRNRTYNLRVAARKLNGTILMPNEVFDFNTTLGPRTQQEGYRIAPVIARGELVDGIAGGVCQISSTLFAAAFFAGLDILKAEVHSQPSHYIDLGLDATVVWPQVTMKLRNPYDFPLVIHYEVNSGRVRAELLGKKRPYKIGFERRIIADRAFKEEIRKDENLLEGKREVEQRGQKGYTVRRRRIFFDQQGHEVKSQYWTVVYPPTTMILRMGTKEPETPTDENGHDGGQDGKDGKDGKDGEDGKDGKDGKDGEDGKDGKDGEDGEDGKDGKKLKPVNPMPDPATFVRKIQ
jgi:vancomycin resistance protein YoaR